MPRTRRILWTIGTIGAALCACDAPAVQSAAPLPAAPEAIEQRALTPALADPPPPRELDMPEQEVTAHPLREVPERAEEVAPPAVPTSRAYTPLDEMPVIETHIEDPMPRVPTVTTDPMPVIGGTTGSMNHPSEPTPPQVNQKR